MIVTRKCANIIKSVELITTGPWPTHYGIRIRLRADPFQVTYIDLSMPLSFGKAIDWAKKNDKVGEKENTKRRAGSSLKLQDSNGALTFAT